MSSEYYTASDEQDEQDGIQALGAELSDNDAPPDYTPDQSAPQAEGEAKPDAPSATKTPAPEGYIAPVAFAKRCGERAGVELKPQVMYGYVKNNKALKEILVDRGVGVTPRFVIPIEAGDAWWDTMRTAKQQKVEAAAQASEAATPQTETPAE